MSRARIGVGSNVGDAAAHVRDAFVRLREVGTVLAESSLYRTKAWGVTDQADFYNAAAMIETTLGPYELLRALKAIEEAMGRVTTFRWGPRVIDLDILAYDDLQMNEPDLTIPHALLHERAFALAPLAEIDASFAPLLAALAPDARAQAERLS